jgi:superfamily I DNA/RNA helicase
MSTWLLPLDDLTPEQIRAVELKPSEHRLIFGGPGSGKTQVLLHRARHLMDLWHVPPERFRIFVFNKALKEYIRSALFLLDIPDTCVITFDAWCRSYYQQHIRGPMPRNGREIDFPEIRRRVCRHLQANLFPQVPYDFIMVDEGQDLDATSFDVLRSIARHITVCIDHKQQIYEGGSSETDILQRLKLKRRNLSLLEAFRCCPFIVSLASALVDDQEEREAYIRQHRTAQTERETPLLFVARNFEEERERLIDIFRVRQAKGEKVAVLLPQKRQVFGFAQGFREADLEIETPDNTNFTNDLPKIMPYHSAKGLTFDTVLLPRLVRTSFPHITDARITRLLFVGITRATKWVYMSTCKDSEIAALQRFESLTRHNLLSVQTGSDGKVHEKREEAPESSDDDMLDIL